MSGAPFELDAVQLRDLFAGVLPLAGRDDQLPVLTCVRFQAHTDGRTLTATATDRFRAGCSRVVVELDDDEPKPLEPFAVNVPARAVRHLLATFRPGRRAERRTVKLSVDGGDVVKHPTGSFVNRSPSITVEGATSFGWATTATVDCLDADFPKVWPILKEANTPAEQPVGVTGLNPTFLADFRHALRPSDGVQAMQVTMPALVSKPIGLAVGDHFLGALMPRRLLDQPAAAPASSTWLHELDERPTS